MTVSLTFLNYLLVKHVFVDVGGLWLQFNCLSKIEAIKLPLHSILTKVKLCDLILIEPYSLKFLFFAQNTHITILLLP